jgi:hypothetical protein
MADIAPLHVYYPLLGLRFGSLELAHIDSACALLKPYPDEWRYLCKSDVWYEVVNSGKDWVFDEHNIPPCLHLHAEYKPDVPFGEDYAFRQAMQFFDHSRARKYVLMLQLYKSGWFFNPFFYQITFSGDQGKYGRQTGPYRQIDIGQHTMFMPARYEIGVEDLIHPGKQKREAPITKVEKLVNSYFNTAGNTSCDYCIHSFGQSYSLFLPYAQKCSYLFTALDVMFGGMSSTELYGTQLRTRFIKRVTQWYMHAAHADADLQWLDDGTIGGRFIRNNVAHGNAEAVEQLSKENYVRLQDVLRELLKVFLSFFVQYHDEPQLFKTTNTADGKSPVELFNIVAEQCIEGQEEAIIQRNAVLAKC